MSGLYDDFEKRFTNSWFSSGWVDVEPQKENRIEQTVEKVLRKDVSTLQKELEEIEANIESISLKQLRLANLAKFYN